MRSRALLPLALLAGFAVLGVAGAAAVDRSVDPVPTAAGFGGGPVHAGTARTEAWATVADLEPRLSPVSDNACERGEPDCLAAVLGEMQARLDAQGCAHTAPFAFTYLEMTRGVRDAVVDPGFFDEPTASAHADALFARLYFDAFDNWEAGRLADVPGVWRIAFGTAERGTANAATDLLLGMNAHIARDLPYVVADIAQWQQEANADPSDFERINDVIARVKGPMLRRSAERFDPSLILLDLPLPALAANDSVELIGRWRNQALERGIRLSQARTAAERAAVEGEIEREAMATAVLLLNAGTTLPSPITVAERDAYCEARRP